MAKVNSTLEQVLAYQNLPIIGKIMKEYNVSESEATRLFTEAKSFLYQCAVNVPNITRPSVDADKAWHVFILFTKDYAKFCKDHFGFFVHHIPDAELPSEVESKRTRRED